MGGGGKGANFVFRVVGVISSDRKHFSNTDPLFCVLRLRRYVCVGGGGVKKIGLLLFESF